MGLIISFSRKELFASIKNRVNIMFLYVHAVHVDEYFKVNKLSIVVYYTATINNQWHV